MGSRCMLASMLKFVSTGLEVIKLEYSLNLKIKCNDWLLADTCPQAANHCALTCNRRHQQTTFSYASFLGDLRVNSGYILKLILKKKFLVSHGWTHAKSVR